MGVSQCGWTFPESSRKRQEQGEEKVLQKKYRGNFRPYKRSGGKAHLADYEKDWTAPQSWKEETDWNESFYGKGKSHKGGRGSKPKGKPFSDNKGDQKGVFKAKGKGHYRKGKSKGKAHLSAQEAEEGETEEPSATDNGSWNVQSDQYQEMWDSTGQECWYTSDWGQTWNTYYCGAATIFIAT